MDNPTKSAIPATPTGEIQSPLGTAKRFEDPVCQRQIEKIAEDIDRRIIEEMVYQVMANKAVVDSNTDSNQRPAEDPFEFKEPTWGDYDFDKPSKAVIARGERDISTVIWTVGAHVRMDIEEAGIDAEDMGLIPPDTGIWVWEGKSTWSPGPWDCPQDGAVEYEGKFRRPTEEELKKIGENQCPWNDEEWKQASTPSE